MATPAWFDYETYMNNKLAQLQETDSSWTMEKLLQTFADEGYDGAEGAYNHFVDYGTSEDVAPNAYFNAEQYYYYKAIQFYNIAEDQSPSAFQVARVQQLIEEAGMNAWTHYVAYGSEEGVNPSSAFDAEAYCADKAAVMNENGNLNDGEAWTAESIAAAINDAGYTVLGHYLEFAGTNSTEEVAAGSTYTVEGGTAVFGQEYTLVAGKDELTGTQYDDTFYAGLDSNGDRTLNSTDVINGAEGSDTLVINNGISLLGSFSNMEKLVINESAGSSYSAEDFSESVTLQNIDELSTEATSNGVTISSLTSQSLTVTGATTALTVNASYGSSSDAKVATISNEDATEDITFTLSGTRLTTVNFQNNGNDEDATTTLNVESLTTLETVNISGDSDVTVTDTSGTGGNFAPGIKIDASELSGQLMMNVTAPTDTISIETGDGGSKLELVAYTTVTGGNGKDEYLFTNDPATTSSAVAIEHQVTIEKFSDEDSITISSLPNTLETLKDIEYAGSVEGTLDKLSSEIGLYVFDDGKDTYLVYNANANTGFNGSDGDILIRLGGVSDAADFDVQNDVITLN